MKKRIHHPHPVWRVTRLVSGIFLVVLGTVSFLIPILPNWLFIIPGLGLLAPESRHIRKLVVWLRARLRLRRFRKAQRRAAAEARHAAEARQAAAADREEM